MLRDRESLLQVACVVYKFGVFDVCMPAVFKKQSRPAGGCTAAVAVQSVVAWYPSRG